VRRYLVVAHRTLGGEHLLEHLRGLRAEDPYCTFHVLVPEYHPKGHTWTDGEVRAAAQSRLDETLDSMASMGMGATGEVGDANPVSAIGDVLRRTGLHHFNGIVLSTLPKGASQWWLLNVPKRVAKQFPSVPLTHIVAEETLVP
jgi:GABA permease